MRKQIKNRIAQAIFKRDKYTCQYCGSNENLSVDHIKPITKGGTDRTINLITSCLPCNRKKQNKILDNPPKPKRVRVKGLPNYIIKIRLDKKTHTAFKSRMAFIGSTMQEWIEQSIIAYLKDKKAL